jgi:hypothetical protein
LGKKLEELESLVEKAAGRLKALEIENRRLTAEMNLLLAEQKKAQTAVRRHRILADGHERIRRRLERLRGKLLKLEI